MDARGMRMRPSRVPGLANLLRRFAPLCIGRPKAAPIYSPLGALFGGYVGTQFWNQGRTEEIRDRVLHL